MSGPKGYSAVVSPRVARERELEARRRRWRALCQQLDALEEQTRVLGMHCSARRDLESAGYPQRRLNKPSDADLDAIDAFSTAVTDALTAARRSIDAQNAHKALQSLSGLQSSIAADGAMIVSNLTSSAPQQSVSGPPTAAQCNWDTKAARLVELVERTGAERVALLEQIQRTLTNQAASERDWLALTTAVTSAVRANDDRIERLRRSDELLSMVARLDNQYVAENLRAKINGSSSLAVLESRRAEILDAIRDEERESERRFILEQAVEVWRELGYQTRTDFHEVALTGQPVMLHNEAWPDHALQVRYVDARQQLRTTVVSLAETSAQRDREVEEDHCADVAAFTAHLVERGVHTNLADAKPAGALRMQRVTRAPIPTQTRKATPATKKTF